MKPLTKSEWFRLDKPIGEPDLKYPYDHYDIKRMLKKMEQLFGSGRQ